MLVTQLGESANTLVKQWKGGYRYGFPTFRAAEPPVRPMHYDQSQIYSGVIGRQYEDSTNRYMYQYDPNMYLQPGFSAAESDMTTRTKIAIGVSVSVLMLGAAAFAGYQLTREPHGHSQRDPYWARDSGRAYRAGRRLRRRRA